MLIIRLSHTLCKMLIRKIAVTPKHLLPDSGLGGRFTDFLYNASCKSVMESRHTDMFPGPCWASDYSMKRFFIIIIIHCWKCMVVPSVVKCLPLLTGYVVRFSVDLPK